MNSLNLSSPPDVYQSDGESFHASMWEERLSRRQIAFDVAESDSEVCVHANIASLQLTRKGTLYSLHDGLSVSAFMLEFPSVDLLKAKSSCLS